MSVSLDKFSPTDLDVIMSPRTPRQRLNLSNCFTSSHTSTESCTVNDATSIVRRSDEDLFASTPDIVKPEQFSVFRTSSRKESSCSKENSVRRVSVSSSSDDDAFENFLRLQKTPAPVKTKVLVDTTNTTGAHDSASFIVDSDETSSCDDTSEEDDLEFYLSLRNTKFERRLSSPSSLPDVAVSSLEPHKSIGPQLLPKSRTVYSSDSEDDTAENNSNLPLARKKSPKTEPRKMKGRRQMSPAPNIRSDPIGRKPAAKEPKEGFLKSLSPDLPLELRDEQAECFLGANFKKTRDQLVRKLFFLYNERVFNNELPNTMQISWHTKLRTTAGRCLYKSLGQQRFACIDLSDKVCDRPDRVRDTLLHELCHAMVWIKHGVREAHGTHFKHWAYKAHLAFPELERVRRCHNYEIRFKYVYRCGRCGQEIKRHSKSLDITKQICGLCHGRFELLVQSKKQQGSEQLEPATPRKPPKFAQFVKENYSSVKGGRKSLMHKDVMKTLGEQFRKVSVSKESEPVSDRLI